MNKNTPKKEVRWKNTLVVFLHIKEGGLPHQLWESKRKNALTIDQVKYALRKLKNQGFIEKVGKAWVAKVDDIPMNVRWKKVHHVGKAHTPPQGGKLKPDDVRAHGFVGTLKMPKLKGWKENRQEILDKLKIKYKYFEQKDVFRISVGDLKKVWLGKDSIVWYMGKLDFYGETPVEAVLSAMDFLLNHVRKLENLIGIGEGRLRTGKGYKLKFSRSHIALVKNALAKRMDKQKIYVYDEKGLWFIIDNSWNLHEAEFVRTESNVDEATFHKEYYLNDLNKTRLLPSTTLDMIQKTQAQIQAVNDNFGYYGDNLKSHVNAINTLAQKVEQLQLAQKMESFEEYTLTKLKIIKDTGKFLGLVPDIDRKLHTKWINLKAGVSITMESMTAYALVKSGFAVKI